MRATGSVFFGNYLWPHEPTEVTGDPQGDLHQRGHQDVTLDLALNPTGGAVHLGDVHR